MAQYDSSFLVEEVKRRGSIPTSQNLFTIDKYVLMLNDELKSRIVPLLMSMREEWFVTYIEYVSDGTTKEYKIPNDAIGSKLRDVTIWENGRQKRDVPRLSPSSLSESIFGFYVQNNSIIFYPEAVSNGKTIRLSYFKRVPDLVKTSEAGEIQLVAGADVTLSLAPPSSFVNGASVQIVSHQSPFEVLWTGEITNVAGSTITLDSSPTVSAKDWLCLAGQSVFPQIPIELIPCLTQSTVAKCLEALGDSEGMQIAMGSYAQLEQSAKSFLSPKVDGAPKKVYNQHRIGRYLV